MMGFLSFFNLHHNGHVNFIRTSSPAFNHIGSLCLLHSTVVFQQFTGVLLKRFHITRRDWRAFIWAVLMPVVFLTLGTVMTLVSPKNIHPELQLTPAMFKDPNYVFFR